MERWFHLGKYQPIVAGVGVIVSAILNPDGVTAAMNRARAGRRRRADAAVVGTVRATTAPVLVRRRI
jgi:hypothetical protein